ncbi:DUF2178 domain-containing protein [Clostridium estertheticum]|uniref:DUF2178 domain-containing protein n=1 Tax=Clostridium estertheticum TaxID=238834 RepID=UPI0013E9757B|nr:DUF2178 domain-containing protein [Clostridium estertheticum]MBZ9689887.1 DUF2178 domain-containing protein [Clostridium estertheticum]
MENKKKTDSIIIGAGIFAIYFIGEGIFGFITKKNGYWVPLVIGILSFLYLIYLLKRTKSNLNERYEDERKKFISEKSSSVSYSILFAVILIYSELINANKIIINTYDSLMIIMGIALIIKPIAFLICKYKY